MMGGVVGEKRDSKKGIRARRGPVRIGMREVDGVMERIRSPGRGKDVAGSFGEVIATFVEDGMHISV